MNPHQEYTEINNNIRHYGNMRFAQLTIFLALTGGLVVLVFTKLDVEKSSLRNLLKTFGIILTSMFFLIEESSTRKWKSLKKRGIEIEKVLGFQQLTNLPRSGLFSATTATRLLYLSILIFWIVSVS